MNAITYNAWHPRHLGFVIVFTALINGSLFAALPWLTRIVSIKPPDENVSPYIVFPKTPPKPPEPLRDMRIKKQELQLTLRPPIHPDTRQNNVLDFDFVVDRSDDRVPVLINGPEKTTPDWEDIIFEPS